VLASFAVSAPVLVPAASVRFVCDDTVSTGLPAAGRRVAGVSGRWSWCRFPCVQAVWAARRPAVGNTNRPGWRGQGPGGGDGRDLEALLLCADAAAVSADAQLMAPNRSAPEAALERRKPGTSHGEAIAHGAGQGAARRRADGQPRDRGIPARLRRLRCAAVPAAADAGRVRGPRPPWPARPTRRRRPAMRLEAIGLVCILRSLVSPELPAAIAGLPPGDGLGYVSDWLLPGGRVTGAAGGWLARTLSIASWMTRSRWPSSR